MNRRTFLASLIGLAAAAKTKLFGPPMTATEILRRREEMSLRFDELRREHEKLLIEQMTEALKLVPRLDSGAVVYNRLT